MNLVAAPCLILPRETPIREAIHQMQVNNQSFVLIKDSKSFIVGIFTDRDLLMKFDSINQGSNLDKPIFTVMSTPVKSLSVSLINTAIEFMYNEGIRHVPIVKNNDKLSEENLCGIVSINNILEPLVNKRHLRGLLNKKANKKERRKTLGIVSPDGQFYDTMDELMTFAPDFRVYRIWMKDLRDEFSIKRQADICDAIIIDLDGYNPKEWPKTLKVFNEHPSLETVIVVYNPDLHTARVVETFNRIQSIGWLHIFAKPLDIAALLNELNSEPEQKAS